MAVNLEQVKNEYYAEIRQIQNFIIRYHERSWFNKMIINADLEEKKIRIIELYAKIEFIEFLLQETKIKNKGE